MEELVTFGETMAVLSPELEGPLSDMHRQKFIIIEQTVRRAI